MRYWNTLLSLWPVTICSYTSSLALLSLAKELEAKIVTWVCLMIAPLKWVTLAKVSGQFFRALFWCPLPLPAVKGTRIIFSLMERSISTSTSPLPKCPPYRNACPHCFQMTLYKLAPLVLPVRERGRSTGGWAKRWSQQCRDWTVSALGFFCFRHVFDLFCGGKSRQF